MLPLIIPDFMNDVWKTQHTLLQRAKNPSDEEAWNEFVHFYEEFIRVVLFQMSYKSSDLEDVIQEILLKIWKSLPEFEFQPDRGRFRTWLSKLIRNKVIDRFRAQKAYDDHVSHVKEQIENQENSWISLPELDKLIERQWQRHVTKKAFENIEPFFSEVALKVFELSMKDKTTKEICLELNIAQDSVRVLKNRVQKRLVEEIQHLKSEMEF